MKLAEGENAGVVNGTLRTRVRRSHPRVSGEDRPLELERNDT